MSLSLALRSYEYWLAQYRRVWRGSVVTGVVKNLTEYGAFVDLGGIDGLLHVSDLSHGRVTHPKEILHPGDEITLEPAALVGTDPSGHRDKAPPVPRRS